MYVTQRRFNDNDGDVEERVWVLWMWPPMLPPRVPGLHPRTCGWMRWSRRVVSGGPA